MKKITLIAVSLFVLFIYNYNIAANNSFTSDPNSNIFVGSITNTIKRFGVNEGYKKISLQVTSTSTGTCKVYGNSISGMSNDTIYMKANDVLNITSSFAINGLYINADASTTVDIIASQQ